MPDATIYTQITPVDEVWVGTAPGSNKGGASATGSVVSVTLKPSRSTVDGKAAATKGAVVAKYHYDPKLLLEIVGDHYALKNLSLALTGAKQASVLAFGSGMTGSPTLLPIWVDGVYADGSKNTLVVPLVDVSTLSSISLALGKQDTYTMTCEAVWDATQATGQELAYTETLATDTTPPTVSSYNANSEGVMSGTPASNTGKARSGYIDITFSEAVRYDTITAGNIILMNEYTADDCIVVPSIYSSDGTIVRVLYGTNASTTALTASKAHILTISGVKDLAGNVLAAPQSVGFTTGT